MTTLEQEFLEPPASYRSRPFWAWNGKLDEKELLRQIDVMHDMGFGGFFMHSRTGLVTQYLGEEWFHLTDVCTRKAGELGMEPWIYDEDRWPSGCAGGMVSKEPQFQYQYLTLSLEGPSDNSKNEKICATSGNQEADCAAPLAEFAAHVDGLKLAPGYRRLDSLRAGETRLVFRIHTMEPKEAFNGYPDADRMNLTATERFLDVTHRQYAARCTMFDQICGVFTDEPHRGMVFSAFGDQGEMRNWSLPWTEDMAEVFEAEYGEPLIPRLPELFLQLDGESFARIKWQYMELIEKLFLTRFLQPIERWGRENNKATTGHFLHEDSLMAQAAPNGSMMRSYEYLDEPGIDNLTEHSFVPWTVKQLESVARQLGKKRKLSELFGATGWQMSFSDYEYIANWQTLLGINVRCPHLSWYTMRGQAKRDYPGSFLHQASWYEEYHALETQFARLGLLISQGEPVCSTLVLHPVESLWYQIHPDWANGIEAADPAIQKTERRFRQLFGWLMETQTDFDYGDEGILEEHARICAGDPAEFCIGRMRYSRVVVCGCEGIRESTLQLLQKFSQAGGEIVWIGGPPGYVAGQSSDLCRMLSKEGSSVRIPMRKKQVLDFFRTLDEHEQPVRVLDDKSAENIYLQIRREKNVGGEDQKSPAAAFFALFWNKSRSRALTDVPVQVPDGMSAELWDLWSGKRYSIPVNEGRIRISLSPGKVCAVRLCGERGNQREKLPDFPDILTDLSEQYADKADSQPGQPVNRRDRGKVHSRFVSLTSPIHYSLNEPNVLVLDIAELRLGNEVLCEKGEVLQLDRILRDQLGMEQRSGEMIQPWARAMAERKLPKAESRGHLIHLVYTVQVEDIPGGTLTLALEDMPSQSLRINGQAEPLLKTEKTWVDNCYSLYSIPASRWKKGANILEYSAEYSDDCGLEAMYLLGNFGVWFRTRQPVIGRLPDTLKIGSITRQGLPFYSGKIKYTFFVPEKSILQDDGEKWLQVSKFGGSCAAVESDGKKIIFWDDRPVQLHQDVSAQPELEIVLNRRNTFGPLHRFPYRQPYATPDTFTCDDISRYSLYPMGLLQAPKLYLKKEE